MQAGKDIHISLSCYGDDGYLDSLSQDDRDILGTHQILGVSHKSDARDGLVTTVWFHPNLDLSNNAVENGLYPNASSVKRNLNLLVTYDVNQDVTSQYSLEAVNLPNSWEHSDTNNLFGATFVESNNEFYCYSPNNPMQNFEHTALPTVSFNACFNPINETVESLHVFQGFLYFKLKNDVSGYVKKGQSMYFSDASSNLDFQLILKGSGLWAEVNNLQVDSVNSSGITVRRLFSDWLGDVSSCDEYECVLDDVPNFRVLGISPPDFTNQVSYDVSQNTLVVVPLGTAVNRAMLDALQDSPLDPQDHRDFSYIVYDTGTSKSTLVFPNPTSQQTKASVLSTTQKVSRNLPSPIFLDRTLVHTASSQKYFPVPNGVAINELFNFNGIKIQIVVPRNGLYYPQFEAQGTLGGPITEGGGGLNEPPTSSNAISAFGHVFSFLTRTMTQSLRSAFGIHISEDEQPVDGSKAQVAFQFKSDKPKLRVTEFNAKDYGCLIAVNGLAYNVNPPASTWFGKRT